MINTDQQSMINIRGRITYVNQWEVESKRSQGWKIIHNPKQEYYPEFDVSSGGQPATENLPENLADVDVLPGVDL